MFGESVALADTIRIFPLAGAILFPRAQLPLHIFEPRYRNMTSDALSGDRLIAMIQPSGEPAADAENPPIFRTGCLGRIDSSEKLEDGRYNIVLTGLTRFDVVEELPVYRGYRRVIAEFEPYKSDLTEDRTSVIDRDRLLQMLDRFMTARSLRADWSMIAKTRDEPLVNALAMICPFSPQEKQALLESTDLTQRCEVLTALLEFAAFGDGADAPGRPAAH